MLMLKNQKNVPIALLTLSLFLIILAEPVLAKKGRPRSGKLPRDSLRSRQFAKPVPGSKIHQRPSAGKARTKVASVAQSAETKPIVHTARLRNRSNFRRTVKSKFRLSNRANPGRHTTRITKTTFDATKHARGSFDAGKLARGSFNPRKPKGVRANNQPTRRSLFTRPANERSQHTRLATEKSQHIRPANEVSQHGATVNKVVTDPRPTASQHRDRLVSHHRYQRHRKDGFSFGLSLGSSHLTRRHHYRRGFRRYRPPVFNRIVWPTYRRIVYYNRGPHFTFRYVYPYHHRKYVFVSLGGYWPLGYRYVRYYRYGCHPYYWYGSYPAIYEVEGNTYNYYTYNYGSDTTGEVTDYTRPVDANTFADVRERLAAQAARKPAPETLADRCFEDGVKAFEAGDYDTAADKFADALDLAPDDMVLPFAYVQALFADQQYSRAVEVLREALAQLPPDKEGVFYPRGLYPDDDVLFEQIGRLAAKVELNPSDEDLQLLLGYQLLGAGKLDRAVELLQQVSPNSENMAPAAKLLELLEKIRAENAEDNDP